MSSEKVIMLVQKATVYDLKRIIEADGADPNRTYTVAELKKLLDAYILGLEQ